MACYHPFRAISQGVNPKTGKKVLRFIKNTSKVSDSWFGEDLVKLPCGNCIGCREDRAKTWAIRCVHEASLYEKNCFITLTYNDEHLPKGGTLVKSHFQLFMKRLRKKYGDGIKFYMCGEYGEKLDRPHYHACLFNFDFPLRSKENPGGKYLWKEIQTSRLYRCGDLESLWTDQSGKSLGFVSVGSVTFDSAAYVARYIVKKINGDLAPGHYQGRLPEFTLMSRGGRNGRGIAYGWFEKFKETDIDLAYRSGFITVNGRTYKIPKYYDLNYEVTDPSLFQIVKEQRIRKAKDNPDNTRERLRARKSCHQARHKMRKRSYES